MTLRYILVILCCCFTGIAQAHLYRVFFTDKGEQSAAQQAEDQPVPAAYMQQVALHCDTIWMTSAWLNYALIESAVYPETLLQFPFVKKIELVQPLQSISLQEKNIFDGDTANPAVIHAHRQWQLDTLGAAYFAEKHANGSGIIIAIIDAGFNLANESKAFTDIFTSHRVLKTYDFIDNDTNVFHGSSHGTAVWSCIAGNMDNKPTGLATGASFILLRSEDEKTETMADEDRWIQAIEMAWQSGARIVNSSVGFTNVLHSRDQLNGQSLISQAATMAASKGMLIVVSAGNEWVTLWKTLAIPADADGVITVGGIDKEGDQSYFSSVGPTADGRTKPEVVAPGTCVVVKGNDFLVVNGTSFAAPLVSGYLACMLQLKGTENFNKDSLLRYGGLYPYFDYVYGYGLPAVQHKETSSSCNMYAFNKETKTFYSTSEISNTRSVIFNHVFLKITDSTGVVKFSKHFSALKGGIFKIKKTTRKIPFNYRTYYNPQPTDRWCIWYNGCYAEY